MDELVNENPEKITFKERRLYFIVGSAMVFVAVLMLMGYPPEQIVSLLAALGIGAVIPSPLSSSRKD